MNINLTPKLEEMVREKVKSGLYNNASEVVREALRMMESHDRKELKVWTLDEIEAELDKVNENNFTEGFSAEEIIRRGRERLAKMNSKNAA